MKTQSNALRRISAWLGLIANVLVIALFIAIPEMWITNNNSWLNVAYRILMPIVLLYSLVKCIREVAGR